MAHAVVFFGGAGELVFFDDAAVVFRNTRGGDEAGLGVATHHLAVEVKTRKRVLRERALLLKQLEVFRALGVHGIGIHIGIGLEIDFRLADVEEIKWVVLRDGARLVAVHHVIGQLANFCSQISLWTQCGKWF